MCRDDTHSRDCKRGLLARLEELLQSATRAADDQLVIGIQEGPASQVMEMGKIMPDVAWTPGCRNRNGDPPRWT